MLHTSQVVNVCEESSTMTQSSASEIKKRHIWDSHEDLIGTCFYCQLKDSDEDAKKIDESNED